MVGDFMDLRLLSAILITVFSFNFTYPNILIDEEEPLGKLNIRKNQIDDLIKKFDAFKKYKAGALSGVERRINQINSSIEDIDNTLKTGKKVVVEGHACNSAGSAKYNMMLSEKRAKKVAAWLKENGFSIKRLHIVGRGCEMPIVSSGSREEQAPNRRVEMYYAR